MQVLLAMQFVELHEYKITLAYANYVPYNVMIQCLKYSPLHLTHAYYNCIDKSKNV